MLKTILKSSGWSQEQLASRLGVSFPTINSWINGKSTPRDRFQKRIENLFLARNADFEGPVYITLEIKDYQPKLGDDILLTKTPEDGLDGFEVYGLEKSYFSDDSRPAEGEDISLHVANSPDRIIFGTTSGGRIYDRINTAAWACVMFIINDRAIAAITDWGPAFNTEEDQDE